MRSLNAQFLSRDELLQLNFKALGENVLIHKSVVLVNCEQISIGSNVRIDPFTVLSETGGVSVGSYVHIASHCSLSGSASITFEDFSGMSGGSRIYSAADSWIGKNLGNPMVPREYRNVEVAPVHFGRHSGLASCSIVMPGVTIAEGALVVGAFSFVNSSLDEWAFYSGRPARRLRDALELKARMRSEQ